MPKILVVGARRARQGVGEFIARWFASAGAQVCAIVGTSEQTVAEAQQNLYERYGIRCHGYASLPTALSQEKPEVVALCTPYEFHEEQLRAIIAAPAHCLCEKPLLWSQTSNTTRAATEIVESFIKQGLYLSLVTQWPYTLKAFYELYPHLKGQAVTRFDMLLGPTTTGINMVLDAAPHVLSLLQHLLGYGEIQGAQAHFHNEQKELLLEFTFHHFAGITNVSCLFIQTPKPPRPAGYAINGCWAKRTIQLPEYNLYFQGNERTVPVEDPLPLLVNDFLLCLQQKKSINRHALIHSVVALECLVDAALQETDFQ